MTQSALDITGEQAGTAHLTASERNSLLASRRRRTALSVLDELTTPVDLESLAAAVAARETDADEPSERTIEQVTIALHHRHLPKLAALDVVEYHRESHQID